VEQLLVDGRERLRELVGSIVEAVDVAIEPLGARRFPWFLALVLRVDGEVRRSDPANSAKHSISIFSCGPEMPQICHDGNDPLLAVGTKDAMGNFVITVSPPLEAGQIIYATDGCFDPVLLGTNTIVDPMAEAPVASRWGIIGLAALLNGVALWGLWRRGWDAAAAILLAAGAWTLARLV
jgi:hypothetical protein